MLITSPQAQSLVIDRLRRCAIIVSVSLSLTLDLNRFGSAQSSLEPPIPAICDLNFARLKSVDIGKERNIVTADTVSPTGTTTPSLWWTTEQLPPQLVTNWIANNSQKQVYLLVNTQAWNILDYIDRYRTIDKFGRSAHDYGYDLKICNSQKVTLADYTCNSPREPNQQPGLNRNTCQIWLNDNGQNGLGVKSK